MVRVCTMGNRRLADSMSTKSGPENNVIWELGVTELNLWQICHRFISLWQICHRFRYALMPRTWPEVDFIANPVGSITRGVVATTHTTLVVVGVRQGGLSVFCPSIVSILVLLEEHIPCVCLFVRVLCVD